MNLTVPILSNETVGMKCQYCGNKAKKVMGNVIYPHRKSLWKQKFFHCAPCDAYVSCHQRSNGKFKSMGQLANKELRRLRMLAHRHFDPLWMGGEMSREQAYYWLAGQMGMTRSEAHIGKFNDDQCRMVVEICKSRIGGCK